MDKYIDAIISVIKAEKLDHSDCNKGRKEAYEHILREIIKNDSIKTSKS